MAGAGGLTDAYRHVHAPAGANKAQDAPALGGRMKPHPHPALCLVTRRAVNRFRGESGSVDHPLVLAGLGRERHWFPSFTYHRDVSGCGHARSVNVNRHLQVHVAGTWSSKHVDTPAENACDEIAAWVWADTHVKLHISRRGRRTRRSTTKAEFGLCPRTARTAPNCRYRGLATSQLQGVGSKSASRPKHSAANGRAQRYPGSWGEIQM